jgi:hypothetical protein
MFQDAVRQSLGPTFTLILTSSKCYSLVPRPHFDPQAWYAMLQISRSLTTFQGTHRRLSQTDKVVGKRRPANHGVC